VLVAERHSVPLEVAIVGLRLVRTWWAVVLANAACWSVIVCFSYFGLLDEHLLVIPEEFLVQEFERESVFSSWNSII